jgi:hypothetical protein
MAINAVFQLPLKPVSVGFIRVLWALNRLMWHRIDEERDDKSFMRIERVSWG